MKFDILFKWYVFWVGAYWDVGHRTLYICPLPMVVLRFEFAGPKDESQHRQDRTPQIMITIPDEELGKMAYEEYHTRIYKLDFKHIWMSWSELSTSQKIDWIRAAKVTQDGTLL